jgi:hypothetical protein
MWGKLGRSWVLHLFPAELTNQVPINKWVKVWRGYPACSRSVRAHRLESDPVEFTLVARPIEANKCKRCLAWLAAHPDGLLDLDWV